MKAASRLVEMSEGERSKARQGEGRGRAEEMCDVSRLLVGGLGEKNSNGGGGGGRGQWSRRRRDERRGEESETAATLCSSGLGRSSWRFDGPGSPQVKT